jgi:hypothetical protein
LSTEITCCVCPVAAACFFAASIALSCCDAQPAIIATPSTIAAPARSQLAPANKFAFIVSPLASFSSVQVVYPTHCTAHCCVWNGAQRNRSIPPPQPVIPVRCNFRPRDRPIRKGL